MFFSKKLVFLSLVLLAGASARAKAKDVIVSGNLIDSNESCATYRFDDNTLSDPDVTVIFKNDVDICFDDRGEIYEFSSPGVIYRGRADEMDAWLYFSVGASSQGCVRDIDNRYRELHITVDGRDVHEDVVANGSGLGYDKRIKYLCVQLTVVDPNTSHGDFKK